MSKMIRKTITVPEELVNEVAKASGNFSQFAAEAIAEKVEAIRKAKFEAEMIAGYSDPINQRNSLQAVEDFKYADAEITDKYWK